MRSILIATLIAAVFAAVKEPKCNQAKTLSVCASDESEAFVTCQTRVGPVRTDCETTDTYCYEYIDSKDGYVKAYCKPKEHDPKCKNTKAVSVCNSDESQSLYYCHADRDILQPCPSGWTCIENLASDGTVSAYCKPN